MRRLCSGPVGSIWIFDNSVIHWIALGEARRSEDVWAGASIPQTKTTCASTVRASGGEKFYGGRRAVWRRASAAVTARVARVAAMVVVPGFIQPWIELHTIA